jgi:hypothetical protein
MVIALTKNTNPPAEASYRTFASKLALHRRGRTPMNCERIAQAQTFWPFLASLPHLFNSAPGGSAPPPTTDNRQPTTDHRPPTTDHRPPTTDHRPPTSDHDLHASSRPTPKTGSPDVGNGSPGHKSRADLSDRRRDSPPAWLATHDRGRRLKSRPGTWRLLRGNRIPER